MGHGHIVGGASWGVAMRVGCRHGQGRAVAEDAGQPPSFHPFLLELQFPRLLVLGLLQVLPHSDVLIMLVLDLRFHRLQLGI